VQAIHEVKEIPLDKLVIGKGQVRLSDVGKDIDELAESIAKIGLLEPIVVCPAEKKGYYEILTGQRRYLAHRQLGKEKILACILTDPVDETTAKVISVTENLVRRELNRRDLITVCTALYKKYASVKSVCEETGLPRSKVEQYVKYDRLKPELRKLVDDGDVDLGVALKAQDIASVTGTYKKDEAIKLAKEMEEMSGPMQKKIAKMVEQAPDQSVDDLIESAKSAENVIELKIKLSTNVNSALSKFAKDEGTNNDIAAGALIEDSLLTKGYFEEE